MSKANSSTPSDSASRRQLANAIRALGMDAVQAANSGHPGMPMGMADIAEVLWNDYLSHNPANPDWWNRDRFVLSNGHGSMLIYALLHLTGYDLPMKELRAFRQLHSMTPGHPEKGYAPGIETTTGPLGQGIANAVGMALAEKLLAARFNRPGHDIVDHHTYVFLGDGCLMEGISHEVCSLAGTLGLGKLILVYDDNGVSIDGEVDGWFTDDTPARFEAYGWQVVANVDGHDSDAIGQALDAARAERDKPTLVCARTVIGFGSPNKAGKASSHGAPLGNDEVALAREQLGWTHAPFEIPNSVYAGFNAAERGASAEAAWDEKLNAYRAAEPALALEFERCMVGGLPDSWAATRDAWVAACNASGESIASRKASENTINAYIGALPELLGGSADLTGSNLTRANGAEFVTAADASGSYIGYGVREFGMCAMVNGIELHGGLRPFAGTFLMFSEYARNALRMAALMKLPAIFVFTHDSIGLGEDGPTHQAVEQAATLRMIPNMHVWRPCDTVETAIAWAAAIERNDGPSSLLFSRQNLTHQPRDADAIAAIGRGGYILDDCDGTPELIVIATGSEVQLAREAAGRVRATGRRVRLVSMPCADVFDTQPQDYRDAVLPPAVRARVAIEAGVGDGWRRYTGLDGAVLSLDTFGESGPANEVFAHFGFTVDNATRVLESVLVDAMAG